MVASLTKVPQYWKKGLSSKFEKSRSLDEFLSISQKQGLSVYFFSLNAAFGHKSHQMKVDFLWEKKRETQRFKF